MATKTKKGNEKGFAKITSTPNPVIRLTKSISDKVICGVCGGIAEYLTIDPVLIRLLFVILALSGGSGVIIYIILCLIVPEATSTATTTQEVIAENSKDLEKTIETAAANVETAVKQKNTQTWIGIGIIALGTILMANNVGWFEIGHYARYIALIGWPVALIVLGLIILNKNKNG